VGKKLQKILSPALGRGLGGQKLKLPLSVPEAVQKASLIGQPVIFYSSVSLVFTKR